MIAFKLFLSTLSLTIFSIANTGRIYIHTNPDKHGFKRRKSVTGGTFKVATRPIRCN